MEYEDSFLHNHAVCPYLEPLELIWHLHSLFIYHPSDYVFKVAVFWVVAPCSLVEVYRHFRGACCLHHQGKDLWNVGKLLRDGATTQKTAVFILAAVKTSNPTYYLLIKRCINSLDSCVAGMPRPVVTWYRNDQLASNVSTVLKTSVGGHLVRNDIVVRNLGRQDLHSQLKCHASNNNRTHPLEATVHVDMNCKYPDSLMSFWRWLVTQHRNKWKIVVSCENTSSLSSSPLSTIIGCFKTRSGVQK
jgi:hypothetical protein